MLCLSTMTLADRFLDRLSERSSEGAIVSEGYLPSPSAPLCSAASLECDAERCSGERNACVSGGCGEGDCELVLTGAGDLDVDDTGGGDRALEGATEGERECECWCGGDWGGESVEGWCTTVVLHHAGVVVYVGAGGGRRRPVAGAERVAGRGGRALEPEMESLRACDGAGT